MVYFYSGVDTCQRRRKKGPPRRRKKGPLGGCELVPVVHGGACGPTGSSVGWLVGSVGSRGLTPAALVEPIAVAVHLKDVDVVGEAVEECTGEPLRTEHLGPFVEGQIGGDQGRAALVALAAFDLPHSDGCFVKAYPAETAEAFCDGHNAAVAFFGGVLSLPFIPSIAETLEFCITTGYPFRHA